LKENPLDESSNYRKDWIPGTARNDRKDWKYPFHTSLPFVPSRPGRGIKIRVK
jgi:hypothetical protein